MLLHISAAIPDHYNHFQTEASYLLSFQLLLHSKNNETSCSAKHLISLYVSYLNKSKKQMRFVSRICFTLILMLQKFQSILELNRIAVHQSSLTIDLRRTKSYQDC